MTRYSILAIGFISFLLLLWPLNLSVGCGPELNFEGYSFVNPNIVNRKSEYAPYFFYFDRFYDQFQESQEEQAKSNLEEWQERFCNQVTVEELGQVIYHSSLVDLKYLQTSIRNKKTPIPPRLRMNGFAQHLKSNRCKETVAYLVFAKECEPNVTRTDSWEPQARNHTVMEALIEDGRKALQKTKSNYIRLRYAYQLIRLAHYKQDYALTLELYDELLPKVDPIESILNDWIRGHQAGAMLRMGKNVEASYLYSLIFANCPGKRESAFRSFHIKTDEEWQACLLLCQDNRERATLYALRATSETSKAAEEMEKMYELYPESEHLELLLVKEIRKLERDQLGLEFNNRKRENKQFFNVPRKNVGAYLLQLQEFVNKVASEGKVERINLWHLASGYLEYLAGDLYAANITFSKVQPKLKNPLLIEQLEVFQLALTINSYDEIGEDEEKAIADMIMEEPLYKKYPDFPDFLNDRLAYVYHSQDDVGKAFRCQYDLSDLKPNPQLEILNNLLEVCNKPREEQTKFERALVLKADGTLMTNDILDMIANWYFIRNRPETALEYLRRIPRNEWDQFQFNPFLDYLGDCIDCPKPDSMQQYNKVEVFEKIFELEYKSKADYEHGAEHLYRLGVAYYNMSYFGHSWDILDYYRSGSSWYYDKDQVFYTYYYPFGNKENQDVTLAQNYFERAHSLAKADDFELKAKASFMAAKCEQKRYYVSKEYQATKGYNQIPRLPDAYSRNFTLLKENYSNTEFYKRVLKECKYFDAFARR